MRDTDEFNPPPQAPKEGVTLDEFYGQAILMALARIYDALLIQIAQSDDATAAALQEQHFKGGYLFPTIHPPARDDDDTEDLSE